MSRIASCLIDNNLEVKSIEDSGDVIVQVDNKPMTDVQSLSDALLSKNQGDTVALMVYRGNQQMTVNVKLGEQEAGG